MAEFWLDSNTLISAANNYYAPDLVPRFWTFLDEQIEHGTVRAPTRVYQELVDFGDPLSKWVKERRNSLFIYPDHEVQQYMTQIADYVKRSYPDNRSRQFLDGADPWIIAHAMADGGRIVTLETKVDRTAKKPKIPNICDHFGVKEAITTWEMLRALGFSL